MTAPTFAFAGGEDECHYQQGGGSVTTTTTQFRVSPVQFADCALVVPAGGSASAFWANSIAYEGTPALFWWTGRLVSAGTFGIGVVNSTLLKFVDALGFVRLRLRCTITSPLTIIAEKVNTAGTATALTNILAPWNFVTSGAGISDQLVVFWDNQASGTLHVYFNNVLVLSFSGDTTTEATAINGHQLGNVYPSSTMAWSEIIASPDTDLRSYDLKTLRPVANGTTHNWDTGTPAPGNVNETTRNDTTLDGSTTAGQIDGYTIPVMPTGTYSIIAIVINAIMQKGPSGPSKADLGVLSGGTDYWSSDFVLTTAWATYSNVWTVDPNTSSNWAALPTNIEARSVT